MLTLSVRRSGAKHNGVNRRSWDGRPIYNIIVAKEVPKTTEAS